MSGVFSMHELGLMESLSNYSVVVAKHEKLARAAYALASGYGKSNEEA